MGRVVARGQSPEAQGETIGQVFQQPAQLSGVDSFQPSAPAPARSLGVSPGSIARVVDGAQGLQFGFGVQTLLNEVPGPAQRMLTPPEFYDLATDTQRPK